MLKTGGFRELKARKNARKHFRIRKGRTLHGRHGRDGREEGGGRGGGGKKKTKKKKKKKGKEGGEKRKKSPPAFDDWQPASGRGPAAGRTLTLACSNHWAVHPGLQDSRRASTPGPASFGVAEKAAGRVIHLVIDLVMGGSWKGGRGGKKKKGTGGKVTHCIGEKKL